MSGLPAGIQRLGRYEVVHEIGSGAMGAVYLGRDGRDLVALKVIHAHLIRQPRFFKRFEREAEAGSRVEHPNVVRTLDHGTSTAGDRPLCYLVMEFVEGRTLRALLRELGCVPEGLLLEIARQTAAGLAGIHEAGVVHRDLKPENVLITSDDQVRIMDLGVAHIANARSPVTRDGAFSGSLPYAAPEQFQNEPASFATDLYALGVVLYELATGHNPFRLDALPAVIHAHLESVPARADEQNPDLSAFLGEVLACLLAKRPADRFASARELLRVIEDGPASTWWKARRQDRAQEPGRPDVPVRRETRLHGRGTELAALERCWQRARDGEGCVVFIEGEAGIGKSRLVDAFLQSAAARDAHLLYGSYAPAGGLGAVSDAILAKLGSDGLEEKLRPYVRGMPSLVAPFAASIQRDALPGADGVPLPDDALHAVLVELMHGLAAERPLLWIVEDLHFADASAHQHALSMARGVAGHPVCLVLTSRPGMPETELAHLSRLESFRRLSVGRLGAREVVLLLQDVFRSEVLADRLGARIALKSDGVPFFVFEVIRDLREKDFIKQLPGGRWMESRPINQLDVPSAVRDLIEARVSDLSKEDRAILDVGSVQGFEFDPQLTAAVLGQRVVGVLQDLAEIERRVGVVRAVGRCYRFDHHQIQEVLVGQLPPPLRDEYHAALADELVRSAGEDPPASLCASACLHYVAGGQERKALAWLERALDHLQATHRQEALVRLGRMVLAAPGCLVGAARVEVLLRVAEGTHRLGDHAAEQGHLLEAQSVAEAMPDAALQSRVGTGLGRYLERRASFEEAGATLEVALQRARAAASPELEIHALGGLGRVCYGRGRFDEARQHYERGRDLARQLGNRQLEARAIGGLGTALGKLGRYAEAVECFRELLVAAQEAHDLLAESQARGNLGLELSNLGRYDEAQEQLEQQLSISAEIGNRHGEARANGVLGALALYRDDTDEARTHYERELEIMCAIGDRRGEALATGNLGIVHNRQGRREEARACFETWLEVSRTIGNRAGEAGAHGQLGFSCMAEGDLAAAREHYAAWQQIAAEIGDRNGEATATSYLGDVLREEGYFADARAFYLRRFEVCCELGDRRGTGHAHLSLGVVALARGRLREAEEHCTEAARIAREIGEGATVTRASRTLSTVARLTGRFAEARRHADAYARYARDTDDPVAEGAATELLAHTFADEHRIEEARAAFQRRLALARDQEARSVVAETLLRLGALEAEVGRAEEALERFEEAGRLSAELSDPDLDVRIACHQASVSSLPQHAEAALRAWPGRYERMPHRDRIEVRYLLWRATGDGDHLDAARSLVEEALAHAPEAHRETMAHAVPLHRAVLQAEPQD